MQSVAYITITIAKITTSVTISVIFPKIRLGSGKGVGMRFGYVLNLAVCWCTNSGGVGFRRDANFRNPVGAVAEAQLQNPRYDVKHTAAAGFEAELAMEAPPVTVSGGSPGTGFPDGFKHYKPFMYSL